MIIKIHTTFLKELAKLPKKERQVVEKFLFEEIESIDKMDEIPDIRKLKNSNNYFRIRFGNYRAGLRFEKGVLYFERILHRKDIYKFYP